jgi:hypothetical protein
MTLAIAGGYQFSVGAATLTGVLIALASDGVRMDASFGAGISFSLIYCGVLLWAFSERRLWVIALVMLPGSFACFEIARLLEPSIRLPS